MSPQACFSRTSRTSPTPGPLPVPRYKQYCEGNKWPNNRDAGDTAQLRRMDAEAKRIVLRMLCMNPADRPTARDLLSELWFW